MDTWATAGMPYWNGIELFLRENGAYEDQAPK